jgi:single-stranded DNA-binding protein
MSIPTWPCIVGEVASQPGVVEDQCRHGAVVRLVSRSGRRRQGDGTYADRVRSFHKLIGYGRAAAERGRARLREGDVIVAAGYARSYSYDQDGAPGSSLEASMCGEHPCRWVAWSESQGENAYPGAERGSRSKDALSASTVTVRSLTASRRKIGVPRRHTPYDISLP